MAKDPVCGMDVDETTARQTAQHDGKTYYFCAPGCKISISGSVPSILTPTPGTGGRSRSPQQRWRHRASDQICRVKRGGRDAAALKASRQLVGENHVGQLGCV